MKIEQIKACRYYYIEDTEEEEGVAVDAAGVRPPPINQMLLL